MRPWRAASTSKRTSPEYPRLMADPGATAERAVERRESQDEWLAVADRVDVQVGFGGVAGGADVADLLTGRHPVAGLDLYGARCEVG